VNDMMNKKQ